MTKDEMIEVLKHALEALNAGEYAHLVMNTDGIKEKVRQAIAELESQEPVAYLCEPDENGLFGLPTPDKGCKDCFPVYRHPQRTWVGLTNKEVFEICYSNYYRDSQLVKMVETKLKERNG